MSKYYVEIEHLTGSGGFEVAKIAALSSADDTLYVMTDAGTLQFEFRNAELAAEAYEKLSKAKKAVV